MAKGHSARELIDAGGYRITTKVESHSPFGFYAPQFKCCILDPEKHPFVKIIESINPHTLDVSQYPMIKVAENKGMEKSFITIDLNVLCDKFMKQILATVPYSVKKELSVEYLSSVHKALSFTIQNHTGAQSKFFNIFLNIDEPVELKPVSFKSFRYCCLFFREIRKLKLTPAEKKFEDEYIHLLTQEEVEHLKSLSFEEMMVLLEKEQAKLTA